MIHKFLNREKFEYGIKAFDELIQTEESPDTFIIFQEQVMQTLAYAEFPEDETYSIIKSVAKKKEGVIELLEEQFKEGFKNQGNNEKDAERVWQIIVDNARYSFNSSHSYCVALDSLFGAFLKSHYPFEYYQTMLEFYSEKKNADKLSAIKNEMKLAYFIELNDMKFGYDNRGFAIDKENNKINQSLLSIKYINEFVTSAIYEVSKLRKFNDFLDLFKVFKETSGITKTHIEKLILIGYFSDFGPQQRLLFLLHGYDLFYKKQMRKSTIDKKLKELNTALFEKYKMKSCLNTYDEICNIISKNADNETALSFTKINSDSLIFDLYNTYPNENIDEIVQIQSELKLAGTILSNKTKIVGTVLAVSKKNKSLLFKSMKTGKEEWIKTNSRFFPKKDDTIALDNIRIEKSAFGRNRYDYIGVNPQLV